MSAALRAARSGTVEFSEPDGAACLERVRAIVAHHGPRSLAPFARTATREPLRPARDRYEPMPTNPSHQHDVADRIACLVDGAELTEYRAGHGRTRVWGHARLGGCSAGIVANQRAHARRPGRPIEVAALNGEVEPFRTGVRQA